MTSPSKRCRSDRLYPRMLGPRELEALRLIEQGPGISVAELADAMGVSMSRAWRYVGRLEASRVAWIGPRSPPRGDASGEAATGNTVDLLEPAWVRRLQPAVP